jgi:hypothetical protein
MRHSVGTRLWGEATAIDYNVEVVGQWGAIEPVRIRAWGVASDVGYRLALPGRPRVGLRADATSGDRRPTDATLGTFNGLFPSAAYFRSHRDGRAGESQGSPAAGRARGESRAVDDGGVARLLAERGR